MCFLIKLGKLADILAMGRDDLIDFLGQACEHDRDYTISYFFDTCIPRNAATMFLLSRRNALWWGYSNAAVVRSVLAWFRPCVDLVNTIETTPLHISLSHSADMLTIMR